MKLLLDSCVSGNVLAAIAAAGHDVEWTGNWPKDPGDELILETAHRDGRIVVTLDKDFGELAVRLHHAHCGIIRLVGMRTNQHADAVLGAVNRFGAELQAGAIVTVDPSRVRIRPDSSRVEPDQPKD